MYTCVCDAFFNKLKFIAKNFLKKLKFSLLKIKEEAMPRYKCREMQIEVVKQNAKHDM